GVPVPLLERSDAAAARARSAVRARQPRGDAAGALGPARTLGRVGGRLGAGVHGLAARAHRDGGRRQAPAGRTRESIRAALRVRLPELTDAVADGGDWRRLRGA